eukprot:TRINITY_DN3026_c0_g3_i1.p1 TRINITY_DN3026_c0_g3~~TRINITY_DN3026_c0_g3_i1.p1  ORF type:complete len:311 (-),score=29.88 TRINITY_DN3026_c0_g3_i1:671-1579(-)
MDQLTTLIPTYIIPAILYVSFISISIFLFYKLSIGEEPTLVPIGLLMVTCYFLHYILLSYVILVEIYSVVNLCMRLPRYHENPNLFGSIPLGILYAIKLDGIYSFSWYFVNAPLFGLMVSCVIWIGYHFVFMLPKDRKFIWMCVFEVLFLVIGFLLFFKFEFGLDVGMTFIAFLVSGFVFLDVVVHTGIDNKYNESLKDPSNVEYKLSRFLITLMIFLKAMQLDGYIELSDWYISLASTAGIFILQSTHFAEIYLNNPTMTRQYTGVMLRSHFGNFLFLCIVYYTNEIWVTATLLPLAIYLT